MAEQVSRQPAHPQSWAGTLERVERGATPMEIKPYDFSSPKKFTKDQLNSLTNLYENFSRVASSYLTSVLRSVCEMSVAGIEEQRYYEFSNSLQDTALLGVIRFKPESEEYDETNVILDVATPFGYLLVERLMGGTEGRFAPRRDYTEIELALLRHIMEYLTGYLQEAWSNYLGVETALRSIETNGRLLQAYAPQDVVVVVTLRLAGEGFEEDARLCMPADNLEKLIRSFSMRYTRAARQHDPAREKRKKDLMMDYLKHSDLEICAVLDQCEMTLGDVLHLREGDVVALNRRISEDICVTVEGVPWYFGRLGEAEWKKAVKIVDVIEH